jgi:diguanylate cyclase (GGDEF)-like protein/excisionase family DNA binding protein
MSPLDPDVNDQAAGPSDDHELRHHVARVLNERRDVIVADTVATFPLSFGARRLEADYCVRLGSQVVRLLTDAIITGHLDARSSDIAALATTALERELTPDQLFTFVRIAMSVAVDELSADPRVGASMDPRPQAVQMVRQAAFDLLAAWTTRSLTLPQAAAIEDPLTTLHSRPVLEAVLAKECYRAERFEHWLTLMLIDIDNLKEINRVQGYGVGDRVLERFGIVLRSYFREHDWVVRYNEDCVAVLLPETSPEDALMLADQTRTMVDERLTFRDYRTDERAPVTVSVAVASARALEGEPIDSERLKAAAEAALARAKGTGRNRVEHAEVLPRLISVEEAAVLLNTNIDGIERLVGEGRLDPVTAGRHVRLERAAVEALARDTR